MEVGCVGLAELGDGGIAVADGEIAEHLIVGAVLFDDVDDVLDFVVKEADDFLLIGIQRGADAVIGEDLLGEVGELSRGGNGDGLEACFGELQDVGVGGITGTGLGVVAVLRVRPGGAFAVGDVERLAVSADAYGVGIEAGGDEALEGALAGSGEVVDGDGVEAAFRDVECFFVG